MNTKYFIKTRMDPSSYYLIINYIKNKNKIILYFLNIIFTNIILLWFENNVYLKNNVLIEKLFMVKKCFELQVRWLFLFESPKVKNPYTFLNVHENLKKKKKK